MRGNGFRKSFCTKGSQKQNQKLARPSLNPGLAALSWPGCSLCVLLGLIAVGLYSFYGTGLGQQLCRLAQGAEHQTLERPQISRSSVRISLRVDFAGSILFARSPGVWPIVLPRNASFFHCLERSPPLSPEGLLRGIWREISKI